MTQSGNRRTTEGAGCGQEGSGSPFNRGETEARKARAWCRRPWESRQGRPCGEPRLEAGDSSPPTDRLPPLIPGSPGGQLGCEGCPHSAGESNQGVRHGLGTTVTHAWPSASSRSLPTPHPLPGCPRDPGLLWGGIHFLTGKARLCSPCLGDTGGWVALWAGPESSLLSFPLQGQNPFELAFSLDQTHHGETDFSLECPARPGEGLRGRGASLAAG